LHIVLDKIDHVLYVIDHIIIQ